MFEDSDTDSTIPPSGSGFAADLKTSSSADLVRHFLAFPTGKLQTKNLILNIYILIKFIYLYTYINILLIYIYLKLIFI